MKREEEEVSTYSSMVFFTVKRMCPWVSERGEVVGVAFGESGGENGLGRPSIAPLRCEPSSGMGRFEVS